MSKAKSWECTQKFRNFPPAYVYPLLDKQSAAVKRSPCSSSDLPSLLSQLWCPLTASFQHEADKRQWQQAQKQLQTICTRRREEAFDLLVLCSLQYREFAATAEAIPPAVKTAIFPNLHNTTSPSQSTCCFRITPYTGCTLEVIIFTVIH